MCIRDSLNNQVDIGVRVELPAKVFEHITDVVYESKPVSYTHLDVYKRQMQGTVLALWAASSAISSSGTPMW